MSIKISYQLIIGHHIKAKGMWSSAKSAASWSILPSHSRWRASRQKFHRGLCFVHSFAKNLILISQPRSDKLELRNLHAWGVWETRLKLENRWQGSLYMYVHDRIRLLTKVIHSSDLVDDWRSNRSFSIRGHGGNLSLACNLSRRDLTSTATSCSFLILVKRVHSALLHQCLNLL